MSFNPDDSTISGSSDAAISSPSDTHFLKYDESSQKWTNQQPAIAQVSGLQGALEAKAPADPVEGLTKVYVAEDENLPAELPVNTLVVELGSTAIGNVAIGDIDGLQSALDGKLNRKNDTVELTDSGSDTFAQVNIADDGSPTANWADRLAFYFDGTRAGYFNEHGELRARPAKPGTVGFRAMAHPSAPGTQEYFQVSALDLTTVALGISKDSINMNHIPRVNTYPAAPSANYIERTYLNYSASTSNPDLHQVYVNGSLASWKDEWGALRGTAPYASGAPLVRAVRQTGDAITSTTAPALEIRDSRGGSPVTAWGRTWEDGSLIRNGNAMADVYVMENGGTPPATLPAGTVIIELDT